MKLAPIIAQLRPLGFKTLGGAMEFAALRTAPGRLPAAYVVPESDDAAANRYASGAVDQRVTETWSIVVVLDAARRAGAEAISEELEDWRQAICAALIGWTHPEASNVTEYAGGRLLSADGTTLAWALRFRAPYHLRKV